MVARNTVPSGEQWESDPVHSVVLAVALATADDPARSVWIRQLLKKRHARSIKHPD